MIEAEIDREQAVFDAVASEREGELDLLRLSMTLAHNRGDLTQGMGFWKRTPLTLSKPTCALPTASDAELET